MTNAELQKLLKTFPNNMEVGIFIPGSSIINPIANVYKGNERYLPMNYNLNAHDKIVLECRVQ